MEDEWIKDKEDYLMLLKFVKVVYVTNMLWFVDLHRWVWSLIESVSYCNNFTRLCEGKFLMYVMNYSFRC